MCWGYPETVFRSLTPRRAEWDRQYINAIIQSDVPDRAEIEKLDFLPGFLRALAQEFRAVQSSIQPVPARDVLTLVHCPSSQGRSYFSALGSSGEHLIYSRTLCTSSQGRSYFSALGSSGEHLIYSRTLWPGFSGFKNLPSFNSNPPTKLSEPNGRPLHSCFPRAFTVCSFCCLYNPPPSQTAELSCPVSLWHCPMGIRLLHPDRIPSHAPYRSS